MKHSVWGKLLCTLLGCILLLLPCAMAVGAEVDTESVEELVDRLLQEDRVPGEIFVRFQKSTSSAEAAAILEDVAGDASEIRFFLSGWEENPLIPRDCFIVVDDARVREILLALNANPAVNFAHPNLIANDSVLESTDETPALVNGVLVCGTSGIPKAPGPKSDEIYRGDINDDKCIDAKDYLIVKRCILGTITTENEADLWCMDFNEDGNVDAKDYLMLKRYVLGTYQQQAESR